MVIQLNTAPLTSTQVAWTAGVLDVRGHLGINRKERAARLWSYFALVQVADTDQQLIQHLCQTWGGRIYYAGTAGRWVWRLRGKEAEALLNSVRPFLKSKHNQCDQLLKLLAIQKQGSPRARQGTPELDDLFSETRYLNRAALV